MRYKSGNLVKIVPYDKMEFVWINNHYDCHLSGLCRYHNKLYKFRTFFRCVTECDGPPDCSLYHLSIVDKVLWLSKKKMFEWCIGYHWSYKDGIILEPRYKFRKPRWFWNRVFNIYYKVGRFNKKVCDNLGWLWY